MRCLIAAPTGFSALMPGDAVILPFLVSYSYLLEFARTPAEQSVESVIKSLVLLYLDAVSLFISHGSVSIGVRKS